MHYRTRRTAATTGQATATAIGSHLPLFPLGRVRPLALQLFNLKDDPFEQKDLAAAQPPSSAA